MTIRVDSLQFEQVKNLSELLVAYTRDMPMIEKAIKQLISEGGRLEDLIPTNTVSSKNPKFMGPLEIMTLAADPGNPPAGKAWVFQVGNQIVARRNSGSAVTEWTATLL